MLNSAYRLPANLDEGFRMIEARTNWEMSGPPGNPNRAYRLDRMRAICTFFGNPQDKIRTIHIAGSKGKGSTAAFLGAILHAAGRKVGIYSSPHLTDYRERFYLPGNTHFPEDEALTIVRSIFRELEHLDSKLPGYGGATTFEILTLMAFMLFVYCDCDTAVIETGLGGRLDATNVIHCPEAVIITRLEKEHVEILGQSIFQIAREKAGILKKGSPAWFGTQGFIAAMALRWLSWRKGIKVQNWHRDIRKVVIRGQGCEIWWHNGSKMPILPGIPGEIQTKNAILALSVAKSLVPALRKDLENNKEPVARLKEQDFQSNETCIVEKVSEAIRNTRLPGRFEFLQENPAIVVDGAHTPVSMYHLIREFQKLPGGMPGNIFTPPTRPPVLIFGCMEDKSIHAMIRTLSGPEGENFGTVIVTSPGGARAANLEYLASLFINAGLYPIIIEEPYEALKTALKIIANSDKTGAILVTGSFYLAGRISQIFRESYSRFSGIKSNRQG